jgi:hypothetical protein
MYRLTIWLIAVAFVFNGVASSAWIDLPMAPALAAQDNHGAATAGGHDAHFDQVDRDVIGATPDHGQASEHDSCLKCCGICNVANVIPDVAAIPVMFSYADVTFRTAQHDLVGHLVALDPAIPKTIV